MTAHDHHNSGLTMRNYKTILKALLYSQLLGIAKQPQINLVLFINCCTKSIIEYPRLFLHTKLVELFDYNFWHDLQTPGIYRLKILCLLPLAKSFSKGRKNSYTLSCGVLIHMFAYKLKNTCHILHSEQIKPYNLHSEQNH